jgi:alanine racemase
MKPAWAGGLLEIDLDAIAANYRLLRDLAAPAICAAVVKADGYGLGADAVARRLQAEGCRHFFVAHLGEGALLRPALMRESAIHVLNGPPPGTGADMEQHGLVPVLNSLEQIGEWQALSRRNCRPMTAVLQFDTGMSRFGLSPEEVQALAADPARLDGIMPILLMSHLGCADTPDHPANAAQLRCFAALAALMPGIPTSLAASSGIFLGADYHLGMIRPGAALYGVNPLPGRPNPMRASVRLQGRIVQTRWIPPGRSVGYGAHFTAAVPSRIATVAVGYADGFLRASGGRGMATLSTADATRLPLVGRISMDCLALDVTSLGDAALPPGTAVDLIGPNRSLDEVAAAAGTIGYEILTALGSRYHRHYVGASDGGTA